MFFRLVDYNDRHWNDNNLSFLTAIGTYENFEGKFSDKNKI